MDRLNQLFKEHGEFSDATFGVNRSANGPLHHLKKEVEEVIKNPNDFEEYADCLLLLIDAFRMSGGNSKELLDAAFDKLDKNKKRDWGLPDENGVVEHLK